MADFEDKGLVLSLLISKISLQFHKEIHGSGSMGWVFIDKAPIIWYSTYDYSRISTVNYARAPRQRSKNSTINTAHWDFANMYWSNGETWCVSTFTSQNPCHFCLIHCVCESKTIALPESFHCQAPHHFQVHMTTRQSLPGLIRSSFKQKEKAETLKLHNTDDNRNPENAYLES